MQTLSHGTQALTQTPTQTGKVNVASDFNDTINVPPGIATLRKHCHTCVFKLISQNESKPIVRDKQLQTHVHP